MKKLLRAASGDPERLVALLVARLALSEGDAERLVERGAVEVDGKRVSEDRDVRIGARVTAFLPDAAEPTVVPLVLAYKDVQVLVIDKPAGLRSQAVRGDSWDTLVAQVHRELDPQASLLHRLDRETSGLVVLPRTDQARRALQASLDAGQIDRRYVARVQGRLEGPRTIDLPIARDPRDARRRIGAPTGEAAVSHVELLSSDGETSCVRLTLEHGRTHQLRVHLASIGHPVLGDALYGGPAAARLCLHADELTFPHPRSETPRRVRSAVPPALGIPNDVLRALHATT